MMGVLMAQADVLISPRIKGVNTPMKIYSYLDSGRCVLATDLQLTHRYFRQKKDTWLSLIPSLLHRE